ncbi:MULTISPECIES: ligase-associated DNA damage response endonuclease PdeM [unclassified Roseovarius]|uniref:ligase-associated DNA damage response endonuclease PdeM n=1 Tax=unclassified Roseovarius TaxID=2614913 RepID=UPI00273F1C50|nr:MULTISPECIES: ligase-associated DNA damage response endonuclease PdeM [unclassified Roseovarius]
MNGFDFEFGGAALTALGSGALYWAAQNLICVSDLHLGKSERRARLGEAPLPPYETRDTLSRLEADLRTTSATVVICLGDSFDDPAAADALPEAEKLWITALQAGRQWIWIEGNHDPGPVDLGGSHRAEYSYDPLIFRHIADPDENHEISGHYHPKTTLNTGHRTITRPSFLIDANRIILPAYGTYTGGLRSHDATLQSLMRSDALAVLTGPTPRPLPLRSVRD